MAWCFYAMSTINPFKYFKTEPEKHKFFRILLRSKSTPLSPSWRYIVCLRYRYFPWNCALSVFSFAGLIACSIWKKRKNQHTNWQWHSDEISVEINDVRHYLWRAVDHKGEVPECYISRRRKKENCIRKFISSKDVGDNINR